MSSQVHHEGLPRGALIAAGVMVFGSIALAALARLTGFGTVHMAPSVPVTMLELRFTDEKDGSVGVWDAGGARIGSFAPGTNGFARGVLRGLARERYRESVGTAPPFRLTRWADGRLTLDDPATARHIDLDVFGPTNVAAFARLIEDTAPGRR
jgi:putative photosynthetic complex assembly protein